MRGPGRKFKAIVFSKQNILLNNNLFKNKFCFLSVMGSGCSSVGRSVASNTSGPPFESSFKDNLLTVNCTEKTI